MTGRTVGLGPVEDDPSACRVGRVILITVIREYFREPRRIFESVLPLQRHRFCCRTLFLQRTVSVSAMKSQVEALLGGVSFAALNLSAFAAPPAALPSWTGPYLGLAFGGGFAQPSNADVVGVFSSFNLIPPPEVQNRHAAIRADSSLAARSLATIGDFAALGSRSGSRICRSAAIPTPTPSLTAQSSASLTRSRVLVALTGSARRAFASAICSYPQLLTYAIGGVAYGHTRNDVNQVFGDTLFGFVIPSASSSTRALSVGWTAGAGIEYALDAQVERKSRVRLCSPLTTRCHRPQLFFLT